MAGYLDTLESDDPVEVTTPDGAVWRMRQPRGRDFDHWRHLYLLVVAPATSQLVGTSYGHLLDMPDGAEKSKAIDEALETIQANEWKDLPDDQKEQRRRLMDERDAALVAACVTHCTPPGVDPEGNPYSPLPVRLQIPGGVTPPEGVRRPQFWRLPLGARQTLITYARRLASGKEVRQQVDSFRPGAGDSEGNPRDE